MRTLAERFWAKVDRSGGPDGCWLWVGGDNGRGYGRFWLNGRYEYSHRVSWIIANGPIAMGLGVLHKCDNQPCCNPEHLFLGTQKVNADDMKTKRRSASGHRHGRAKLSDADVGAARFANAAYGTSAKELATALGASVSHMRSILKYRFRRST